MSRCSHEKCSKKAHVVFEVKAEREDGSIIVKKQGHLCAKHASRLLREMTTEKRYRK